MALSRRTLGLFGEYIALLYLVCKGYRILYHRYKAKTGEVDIVAMRGELLVFVEVKTRRDLSFLPLSEIISPQQLRRLHNTADWFRVYHKQYKDYSIRCDAIFIQLGKWPKHITHL